MASKFTLISLEDERAKGNKWIFGPFLAREQPTFSEDVEIGYVNLNKVEESDKLHYHSVIHEYYVLISGSMHIQVEDEIVHVKEGDILEIKPYSKHLILEVQQNTRILLIKAPAQMNDKVLV